MKSLSLGCGLVPLALAVVTVPQVTADQTTQWIDPAEVYDCGTMALYTLLQLEGQSVELHRIETHLPSPTTEGFSMAELRDAARACGLKLAGICMPRRDPAFDRPMLVHLGVGQHGHFVVVRPVGHTSKMVQMLDGTYPPRLLDAADLYASPGWTGLALVPVRPNWPARMAGAAGVAVCAGLAAIQIMQRRRQNAGASSMVAADETAIAG